MIGMQKVSLSRGLSDHVLSILAGLLLLCATPFSYAGFIELNVLGEVRSDSQNSQNDFGLSLGDTVSLTAIFDASQFTGSGMESISLGSGSGNSLSLHMGQLTFSAANDSNFFIGFPTIHFIDGIFASLDYYSYTGTNGAPATLFSNIGGWYGIDDSRNMISGMWDTKTAQVQPAPDIPEPGPFALAILGLFGAWLASKREKTLS